MQSSGSCSFGAVLLAFPVVMSAQSAGVPLFLECYASGFVIELSHMTFWCVVAFPEGPIPHELPKSVAAIVVAGAGRSALLGCRTHGAHNLGRLSTRDSHSSAAQAKTCNSSNRCSSSNSYSSSNV